MTPSQIKDEAFRLAQDFVIQHCIAPSDQEAFALKFYDNLANYDSMTAAAIAAQIAVIMHEHWPDVVPYFADGLAEVQADYEEPSVPWSEIVGKPIASREEMQRRAEVARKNIEALGTPEDVR